MSSSVTNSRNDSRSLASKMGCDGFELSKFIYILTRYPITQWKTQKDFELIFSKHSVVDESSEEFITINRLVKNIITKQYQQVEHSLREGINNQIDAKFKSGLTKTPIQISLFDDELTISGDGKGIDWEILATFLIPGYSTNPRALTAIKEGQKDLSGRFGYGGLTPLRYLYSLDEDSFIPVFTRARFGLELNVKAQIDHQIYNVTFVYNAESNRVFINVSPLQNKKRKVTIFTRKDDCSLKIKFWKKPDGVFFDVKEKSKEFEGTDLKIISPLIGISHSKIINDIQKNYFFFEAFEINVNDRPINPRDSISKYAFEGGCFYYTSVASNQKSNQKRSFLSVCEDGRFICEYVLEGSYYLSKAAISFDKVKQTQDRSSINPEDSQLRYLVMKFIERLWLDETLSHSHKALFLNTLYPILNTLELISNVRNIINDERSNFIFLPDIEALHHYKSETIVFFNPIFFKSIHLPKIKDIGYLKTHVIKDFIHPFTFFNLDAPSVLISESLFNCNDAITIFNINLIRACYLLEEGKPLIFEASDHLNGQFIEEKKDFDVVEIPAHRETVVYEEFDDVEVKSVDQFFFMSYIDQDNSSNFSIILNSWINFYKNASYNENISFKKEKGIFLIDFFKNNSTLLVNIDHSSLWSFVFNILEELDSTVKINALLRAVVIFSYQKDSHFQKLFFHFLLNENVLFDLTQSFDNFEEISTEFLKLVRMIISFGINDIISVKNFLKNIYKPKETVIFFDNINRSTTNKEIKRKVFELYSHIDTGYFSKASVKDLLEIIEYIDVETFEYLDIELYQDECLDIRKLIGSLSINTEVKKAATTCYLCFRKLEDITSLDLNVNVFFENTLRYLVLGFATSNNIKSVVKDFLLTIRRIREFDASFLDEEFVEDDFLMSVKEKYFHDKSSENLKSLKNAYYITWENLQLIGDLARTLLLNSLFGIDARFSQLDYTFPQVAPTNLRPLSENDALVTFFGTSTFAKNRIEKTMLQTQKKNAWILEDVNNAIQAGATEIQFDVYLEDHHHIIISIFDNGSGMSERETDAFIIPTRTTKQKEGYNQNYGTGAYTNFIFPNVYIETCKQDHVGRELHFSKTSDCSLDFYTQQKMLKFNGTRILLRKKVEVTPFFDLMEIKSEVIARCKYITAASIYFQNEKINEKHFVAPILLHRETCYIQSERNEIVIELTNGEGGLYRDYQKIDETSERLFLMVPDFIREIIKKNLLSWKVFLPKVEELMNRVQIWGQEHVEKLIQKAIRNTAKKYCIQQWLEGRELNLISDDFWNDFRYDFHLQPTSDILQKERIYNELYNFSAAPDNQKVDWLIGEKTVSTEHLHELISNNQIEDVEEISNATVIKLLNEPVSENDFSIVQIRDCIKKLLTQSILNANGTINFSFLENRTFEEISNTLREVFFHFRKTIPKHFDTLLSVFEKKINYNLFHIKHTKIVSVEKFHDRFVLEKFIKKVALSLWQKNIEIIFYSASDGRNAFTKRAQNNIWVNLTSPIFSTISMGTFKTIKDAFDEKAISMHEVLSDFKKIVNCLEVICHEVIHIEENSDCASTHDPLFRKKIARKLQSAAIFSKNNLIRDVINSLLGF